MSGTGPSGVAWKGSRVTELFHGTWWELHKKKTYDQLKVGRYTKMFPEGAKFNGTDLQRLAGRRPG